MKVKQQLVADFVNNRAMTIGHVKYKGIKSQVQLQFNLVYKVFLFFFNLVYWKKEKEIHH